MVNCKTDFSYSGDKISECWEYVETRGGVLAYIRIVINLCYFPVTALGELWLYDISSSCFRLAHVTVINAWRLTHFIVDIG